MSVTNRCPIATAMWLIPNVDQQSTMHSRGKKKPQTWHQSSKKVFPTKPKAWFIKPTGTIIHLAICRPNHRMSFLPKKQNSCKVRCAGKTKSSVPKSLCKQKGFVGSTSHEFFVLLHFYLLEKNEHRAMLPTGSSQNFFREQCSKIPLWCLLCFKWAFQEGKLIV